MKVGQTERERAEHRVAKILLQLFCFPLLCAMVAMPLIQERRFYGTQDELSQLTPVGESGVAPLVPVAWMKKRIKGVKFDNCEFQPRPKQHQKQYIQLIRVIGERHSGVESLAQSIAKMFPNVTVGTGFTRNKYWFQSERVLLNEPALVDLSKVLVITVLRNPFDWLRSFRKAPYHAPNHNFKSDWRSFLTKPWAMRTSSTDQSIASVEGVKCQHKFLAGEVLPCRQSRFNLVGQSTRKTNMPVYEMDPITRQPLPNVLFLRKHKLLNYANLTTWVPNHTFVKIEDLLEERGLNNFRQILASRYNLGSCETTDGAPNRLDDVQLRHPPSSLQEIDFLNCNIDWEAEALFGYSRIDDLPDHILPCSTDASDRRYAGQTLGRGSSPESPLSSSSEHPRFTKGS